MYPYITLPHITIPSYGLCIVIAICTVTVWSIIRAKKDRIPMEDILVLTASSVGIGLLGAKGLYIVVSYFNGEGIRAIMDNGVDAFAATGGVFYGGLIGGLVGASVGIKILKRSWRDYEKSIVPCIPLGHAIGRVGCLLSGCCYGIEYSGWGAIYYSGIGYFPVQMVEAVANVGIAWCLFRKSAEERKSSILTEQYIILYAVLRFFIEYMRGDTMRGILWKFTTSQWISLLLFSICCMKLFLEKNKTYE